MSWSLMQRLCHSKCISSNAHMYLMGKISNQNHVNLSLRLRGVFCSSRSPSHTTMLIGLTQKHLSTEATSAELTGDSSPATPALVEPRGVASYERELTYPNPHRGPAQAWVENLNTVEKQRRGILGLHPDVWATFPRLDMLHKNAVWQRNYKRISLACTKSRADRRGGGRKPWPQKGTGRARHGSIRSPLWRSGGRAHGPHGPKSYFYMLPLAQRVTGLRVALSVKLAQDDLYVVDSFELPSSEPQYLEDIADIRGWGHSVLFVDDTDVMPESMALAAHGTRGFNLMPTYGVNVYSLLKHESLVLTVAAALKLEERLLEAMNKRDYREEKYHQGSGFNPSDIKYEKFTS